MIHKTGIDSFLSLSRHFPILDVRSPGEYTQAHIPGACAFSLFSDEERKVVGTAYKAEGREKAIKIGLDYFGVKMRGLVEEAERIIIDHKAKRLKEPTDLPDNTVLVHCWRGGMRSEGIAWLLDLYGFNVYLLSGGYKAFRHWVLKKLEEPRTFNIIGGYTGSGKTGIIKELMNTGQPVIDLEGIARHKGSAFGGLGEDAQPTQEMFENELAFALEAVWANHLSEAIWLEDESRRIGLINIPDAIYNAMYRSVVYFIDVPFEARLRHITMSYGLFEKEELIKAVTRIQKRLGGLNAKNATRLLQEENYTEAFRTLLHYYDKYYTKDLKKREEANNTQVIITCSDIDAKMNSELLLAQKTMA